MKSISAIFLRLHIPLLLCLLFFANSVLAVDSKEIKTQLKKLDHIKKHLKSKKYNNDDLTEWTRLTIRLESTANICMEEKNILLSPLDKKLEGLGEATQNEPKSIKLSRKKILEEKTAIDQEIAQCNLYSLTIEELHNKLNDARVSYLEDIYLHRQPHIISLFIKFITNPFSLLSDASTFIWNNSGVLEINANEWGFSLIFGFIACVLAWRTRIILQKIEAKRQWDNDTLPQLYHGVLTTGAHTAPWILISTSVFLFIYYATIDKEQTLFITQISFAISLYILALGISRLFLSPIPPAKQFIGYTDEVNKNIFKRLKILLLTTLIGYSAFYTIISESLGETNLLLVRYIFSFFIVINIVWMIHLLTKLPRYPALSLLARLVNIILLITLAVEWIGYSNLSIAIRKGVLASFILLIVFLSLAKAFQIIFNTMDAGKKAWTKKLHQKLSVENGERLPGLIWFRLTLSILIWGGFTLTIVSIWDLNGGIVEHLKSYLLNGFSIGEIRIIPGRILWALVIFASLLSLAGWLKSQLENEWLVMTNMNAGARDAMATIIGYILFIIAVLLGLSAAGFDFSNIAIVAGALSVGIGFGLQNIVNNFVSGLILLFERPIRKGDWVVVGDTEGFVKNIHIRSTLIRTFDNSDVIVPNSELISNQVTNWMLSSKQGRAIIPVGVAYGSDIERVRDILLDIAKNNEKIIQTGSSTEPRVLFREFGDSSLNFELRVFLKEINGRLGLISDLNFAIDKAFREASIEIPFPQRDVHVRTLPAQDNTAQ
jgi:potassium-dependent mechanosensitive channel